MLTIFHITSFIFQFKWVRYQQANVSFVGWFTQLANTTVPPGISSCKYLETANIVRTSLCGATGFNLAMCKSPLSKLVVTR